MHCRQVESTYRRFRRPIGACRDSAEETTAKCLRRLDFNFSWKNRQIMGQHAIAINNGVNELTGKIAGYIEDC